MNIAAALLSSLILLVSVPVDGNAELADAPCYECHDELQDTFAEGVVHAPVGEGDCEACHEDHGDEEKLMLSEAVPALCFGCHDEFSAEHRHAPVEEGDCLACHNPHHGQQSNLLTQAVPGLCHDCHDEPDANGSVHAPVADGECTECHDPHEGTGGLMLGGRYDQSRRVEFSTDAFALCFNCHDADGFARPDGNGSGFRDGNRGLHFAHLIGEEPKPGASARKRRRAGYSCSACHAAHASPQDRLLRPDMKRGPMTVYTIDFKPSEQGGGCVVGCHKPYQYTRSPEG